MSLLYNKLIESIKTAIYESLFDDIEDDIILDDNTTIIDNISNNYKFVNLGLPSGTLWCTKNLCAETETDPGNYYQRDIQNQYMLSVYLKMNIQKI